MQLDANWVGAIGQVIGAAIAAGAAWLAYLTAKTAKQIGTNAVKATERQTAIAAIHDLSSDYAGPEMYRALRCFGRFVADDAERKEKFERITKQFVASKRHLDLDTARNDAFSWAVTAVEDDLELGAARRQIRHHFKRVWTLRRAGVLSYPDDLKLLTSEAAGWDLWRNEVLPVTLALALHQRARGRHFTTTDNSWAHELIGWVEEASTASKSPN